MDTAKVTHEHTAIIHHGRLVIARQNMVHSFGISGRDHSRSCVVFEYGAK